MLHSGRQLPDDGPALRNDGVGIVMNPVMTDAWKRAGKSWKAVSSRIVVARFLVRSAGTKFSRKRWSRRSDLFLTIINVYAPTSKASLPLKNQFFEDLQRSVDDVPGGDILLVLGDFNARVGTCSEQSGDGLWRSALGSFGLGGRNAAGDRLLMWCAMNQFSILNTFFQKPDYNVAHGCIPLQESTT